MLYFLEIAEQIKKQEEELDEIDVKNINEYYNKKTSFKVENLDNIIGTDNGLAESKGGCCK